MKRFIFIIFQLLLAYSWGNFTDDAPNRDPETFELKYNDSLFCDLSHQHLLCRRGKGEDTAFNPLKGEIAEDCTNKDEVTLYLPDSIAERKYILKYFNKKRSKVAKETFAIKDFFLPPATDMRALRWDYLCEQAALNQVKYCEQLLIKKPCGVYNFYIYEVNFRTILYDTQFPSKPYKQFWDTLLDQLFSGFQYKGQTPEEMIKIESESNYIEFLNKPMLELFLNSETSVLGVKAALREKEKKLYVTFVMGGFTKWKNSSVYKEGDEACSNCKNSSKCSETTKLCVCPNDFSCFNNRSDANDCYLDWYNILKADCPADLSYPNYNLSSILEFVDDTLPEDDKERYSKIILDQPLTRAILCPDWRRIRIEHLKEIFLENIAGAGDTTEEPTTEAFDRYIKEETTDPPAAEEPENQKPISKCPNKQTLNGMFALYIYAIHCFENYNRI